MKGHLVFLDLLEKPDLHQRKSGPSSHNPFFLLLIFDIVTAIAVLALGFLSCASIPVELGRDADQTVILSPFRRTHEESSEKENVKVIEGGGG